MQHNLRIDVSVLQPQDSIPEKALWIGALTQSDSSYPNPRPSYALQAN